MTDLSSRADIGGYQRRTFELTEFEFRAGPVFAHVVMADEINRAPAKTQSALLEAMQEGSVTVEGDTYALPSPFIVIATQNDTHATGTFPLPEPQLDRFLLSLQRTLPDAGKQTELRLSHAARGTEPETTPDFDLDGATILSLQKIAAELPVSLAVAQYITALCEALRRLAGSDESVSVRASLAILRAARANAFLESAPAVYPDHVQAVFPAVMRHRILSEQDFDPLELIGMALTKTPVR